MDQSQTPAKPLASISAADLIHLRSTETAEGAPELSPEAIENRQNAAAELAHLFELRSNQAFQWWEQTFLVGPHKDALDALKSPNTRPEDLPATRTRYVALREIRAAAIEREIAHRQLISPQDEEIARLRERLSLL